MTAGPTTAVSQCTPFHTHSTGSHVIVAGTANLKICVYGLPNAKLSCIYKFHHDWSWAQKRPKCNPSFVHFPLQIKIWLRYHSCR